MRAFNAVIYHQEKLRLLADHVRLAKRGLEDNQKLREKKKEKLPAGELVLLQFEIRDAEAHLVNGRGPLVAAEQDLRAVLGGAVLPPVVGSLAITMRDWPAAELQAQARTLRPDLQARQAAQAEATAALALERTARFGNPVVGPSYGSQETNVQYLGATLEFPLPVCNRKQGEIRLRAAELHKAALEIRQLEIEIDQEIDSALLRFRQVQESIRLYRDDFLPALQARYQELQKLYNENDPGVDVQQVLELYNRLLRVRASYLDALYEHGQIEVDLALAVGDLELAFDP
jgi:outer membrane protein TolC